MPIHDWTRVGAGIFHDFHLSWLATIKQALNSGLLPPDHYALAEQIAGGLGPDVLTLQVPANGPAVPSGPFAGRIALATAMPKAQYHAKTEIDEYAAKAKAIVIRHASDHRIIAVIEIISPGNKSNRHGLRAFVEKAAEFLRAGIHLSMIDLFPPTPRAPQGIHKAIWDEFADSDFTLPPDRPLTLAAYIGGPCPEAFVEPMGVGQPLPEMSLFLTMGEYILVPLEPTYRAAWEAVPAYWRRVLEGK
jgi:hypothetical protein